MNEEQFKPPYWLTVILYVFGLVSKFAEGLFFSSLGSLAFLLLPILDAKKLLDPDWYRTLLSSTIVLGWLSSLLSGKNLMEKIKIRKDAAK